MRINYNVTGAKRKELAQTIGTVLELKPKYMGMPSAAYQIGSFTLSKNGVLDYFESTDIEDVRKVLDAITAAGFEPAEPEEPETEEEYEEPEETATEADTEPQEGDSEADADEESNEEETDEGQDSTESEADEEGIDSDDSETEPEDDGPADLSISLPDNLTDEAFGNLQKVIASKQTLMRHAFQSEGISVERKDGQIVFSGFTASDGDHTDAYMRYIILLTKFAKEAKRVTGKDYPVDNEKFAFRCFLIRIGMVGTEFKPARKILLENLTGNSSWKNGAPEKAAAPAEETVESTEDASTESAEETEMAANE